jgi:hypothetical protein
MEVNMRGDARRKTNAKYSVCWQQRTGTMQSAEVQAVDISKSGIRIRCAVELPPGTTVYIGATDGQPSGYGAVRHCAYRDGSYQVGLEFDPETKNAIAVAQPNHDMDYYEFLQISPKAEVPTIQRIYRFMVSRFHPDNPETGDLEKFLLLKQAYEVLSDPEQRAVYDALREKHETHAMPIFETREFVIGIEGEVNRRLGVLSLLYNRRRTNSENPKVSLYELEKSMGWPREYLDFATWYLRSKQYVVREDNADFSLTAAGVDFVESNYAQIPILNKLLNSGPMTATSVTADTRKPDAPPVFIMEHGTAAGGDLAASAGARLE